MTVLNQSYTLKNTDQYRGERVKKNLIKFSLNTCTPPESILPERIKIYVIKSSTKLFYIVQWK